MNKIVIIDEQACIGCGACVEMCPQGILYVDESEGVCKVTDESKCDKYAGCENVCPTEAIKINQ